MPAGEEISFSQRQRESIERAVRAARQESGLPIYVFVGELGDPPREIAQRVHAGLPDPAGAVLVAVDPALRQLEVVTGAQASLRLDDRSCGLAAVSMTSAFEAGDLAGGIATGVRMLAEHASSARSAR